MTLPWRHRTGLKRLSENEPSIEIAGKSRLVSLKDTRDAAARLSTAGTPRADLPIPTQSFNIPFSLCSGLETSVL